MPLFSDHITNMYYSGTPYSSAPYSYSANPIGMSYSASYLNPGGNYSKHSSLGSYSRAPLTPRWTPSSARNYSPILSTISERSTSSPVRINSPRRIPISKRTYAVPSYTPRPIHINTADIDVSRDRYRPKSEPTPLPAPQQSDVSVNDSSNKDTGPFMPRVDGKPETGIDSSPGHQRSTIKRGRTVVRLHTIKRKDRDSPRKPTESIVSSANNNQATELEVNEVSPPDPPETSLGWRDKLSDDLIYKDKRERKTLGAKLVEKFIVKEKNENDDSTYKKDSPKKETLLQCLTPPNRSKTVTKSKSPERRCSMELLTEQANVLDSLIRSENLCSATLDLTKVGTEEESNNTQMMESIKRRKINNSLQTTKSDHSLHDRINSFRSSRDKHFSKKRSLKKSASGGSIRRLDSITEFPKELTLTNLPAIEESRLSIKNKESPCKPKVKPKISGSVEVSPPKSPLKFKVDDVTVEEITHAPKKEISYSSTIDEVININEIEANSEIKVNTKRKKSVKVDGDAPSPEPDDGNFWDKIGKRETVYLMKRKQLLHDKVQKNRRALYWFPEDGESETTEGNNCNEPLYTNPTDVVQEPVETLSTNFEVIENKESDSFTSDISNVEEPLRKKNNGREENLTIESKSEVEHHENVLDKVPIKPSSLMSESPVTFKDQDEKCDINSEKKENIKSPKVSIYESNDKTDLSSTLHSKEHNQLTEAPKNIALTESNSSAPPYVIFDSPKQDSMSKKCTGVAIDLKELSKNDLSNKTGTVFSPVKGKESADLKILPEQEGQSLNKKSNYLDKEEPKQNETDLKNKALATSNIDDAAIKISLHDSCQTDVKNIVSKDPSSPVDKKLPPKHEEETSLLKKCDESVLTVMDRNMKIEMKNLDTIEKEANTKLPENIPEDKKKSLLVTQDEIEKNKKAEPAPAVVKEQENNQPQAQIKLLDECQKAENVILVNEKKVAKQTPPKYGINVTTRKPAKDEPAMRPLIATPRPLQKKAPQIIHSSSSSESSSEEESSDDADESESSDGSGEFFECENNPDGRTSTGSNDSGFDSSAPTSPAGFIHIKKGGETPGSSASAPASSSNNTPDLLEQELESSTAYGIYRKTGRFTPPARSIPRFRKYNIEDFHFIKVLGKGSFGKVLLAELRDTEYYYAVKCLKKDVVLEDDDVECTLIERKVLALGTNHPYLCHLFATFQTDSHLFFVMEYLNGGDLMFHIQQSGRFPEARARFYAAEIVSGLKFLHKRGIVYRDLKLDNILLDYEGHVRIADFGMCKLQIFLEKTADTFCGTPDYMAPEIIKGLKYNQTVDWWSFGVLLYEMLIGQSPFSGCDEDELFWSICNEMPSYPRFLSQESLTILTRLLDKDARSRLGGVDCMHGDVRDQDFFRSIPWDRLERRELEAPFKPRVRHPLDTQYFDRAFTGERPRLTAVEPLVLRSMDQEPFRGFSYTNPNATDR